MVLMCMLLLFLVSLYLGSVKLFRLRWLWLLIGMLLRLGVMVYVCGLCVVVLGSMCICMMLFLSMKILMVVFVLDVSSIWFVWWLLMWNMGG